MQPSTGHSSRILAIALAAALSSGAAARPAALLPETQRVALPVAVQRAADYTANPAQMYYRDSTTLSSATAAADVLRQQKPVMEQLGTGHTLLSLSAESYTRLTPASVVWGAARFRTGTYRSLRWTDCIDYDRVAPYVLGDEAGGNLSTRSYTFSGGYARSCFGAWTLGADAAYRAEIAYRSHDPRVKTIVSDLDLRLGATCAFGSHALGISAALNVYSQNCDVDFYNPINDINTYTLTGMGTFYRRFMGNTNKNSGYRGTGYTVAAQWLPDGSGGPAASLSFNSYRMEQMLRSFNNITLGYTDNSTLAATVAWSMELAPALVFRPVAKAGARKRRGTENLFGTAAGSSYDKIGDRKPYSHNTARASVELPLQIGFGTSFLTVAPSAAYDYSLEEYTSPARRLCASRITPALMADFSARGARWLWNVRCSGFYGIASSERPVLTDLDTSTPLGRSVVANFDMLRADSAGFGIYARVSRALRKVVLSLSASFNYTDYKGQGNCRGAGLGLSAEF